MIRIAAAAALIGGTLLAAATLWWCWPAIGDPFGHLPVAAGPLRQTGERIERADGRIVRYLDFAAANLGAVRIAVSLPDPPPRRPLPVLAAIGGLRTGRDAARQISGLGGNALVAFEYPLERQPGHGAELLLKSPALRAQMLAVPGQMLAVLEWTRGQPWADPARVTPVGVSLGALFLPAVLRLDQRRGGGAQRAVIAYGGADIAALVQGQTRSRPAWLSPILGRAAALALAPLEPATHLPKLRGEFLLVSGSEADTMIPESASRLMESLLPEPKTVRRLPGGHVRGAEAAAAALVPELRAWLGRRGAIER